MCLPSAVSMLGQRRRRLTIIEKTLAEFRVFASKKQNSRTHIIHQPS